MKALHFGVDRVHAPGEYCHRVVFKHWLLCCFATPFLYETESGMKAGKPGDLLLMAPGHVVYHGPIAEEEAFINDWIQVAGEDFSALLQRYPLPLNQPFSVGAPKLLGRSIEKIIEEQRLCSVGYEEKISCILAEAVIDLHRLYHRARSGIELVREQLMRNPERDWSLQEMAAFAGFSVSRFSQLYRQRYQCAPKADLLRLRLRTAEQLLLNSGLNVGEISERCGYKSIYHFSKIFKKHAGMAPAAYRKTSAAYR